MSSTSEDQKIEFNKYCSEFILTKIDGKCLEVVNRKKKKKIFCQNNARSHVCLVTKQIFLQVSWEVFAYMSPNCYLLSSLKNFLSE